MNRTIFIAEDNRQILELYNELFLIVNTEMRRDDQFNVKLFENGLDLVNAFEDYFISGKRVPLCILDIRMPVMGGFEAAEKIRKIDPDSMMIFVTGHTDKTLRELRETLIHNYYFIRKPFTEDEILSLTDSLIKNWNKTQELVRSSNIIKEKTSELNKSKEKFRRLTENLKNEFFFYTHDTDMKYTFISDSITSVLGYSKENFQKNVRKYLTKNPVNKLAKRFTQLCIEGKQQPTFEVEINHKSGKIVTLEVSEFPIYDNDNKVIAIEGMAHDVSRSKDFQRTVKEQNAFLSNVIDSLQHPFYVINVKDYSLMISNSAARESGSTSITTCHALTHNSTKPCSGKEHPCPLDLVKKTGKPVVVEHIHKDKNGDPCNLEVHGFPVFNDKGEVVQMIEYSLDITDRKRAEFELEHAKEKYKNMFELSPEAIMLTDNNSTIIDINSRIYEWLGYTPEEVIGINVIKLPFFSKTNRRLMLEKFKEVLEKKELIPFELEFLTKKGKVRIGEVLSTPMKDQEGEQTGYLFLIQDVTERNKSALIEQTIYKIANAVTEINEIEELFKFIQKTLNDIIDTQNFYIALYDKDDNTISLPYLVDAKENVNKIPLENTFTGYVIRKGKSLLADEKIQKQMIESGEVGQIGTPSKVWLGVPLRSEKEIIGVVAVQSYDNPDLYNEGDKDILEFVSYQITQVILKKNYENELKKAKETAEYATKAKADFLASMSHEIRTPMNGVIGMTGLLMDTSLTLEQKEYVDTIRVSGDSLLTIINDILDFSKIESGKMELEYQPFDLRTCIEEAYDLISTKAAEKRLDLLYLIEPEVPINIIGDITRLRQILVNLVNNAVKFTEKGEIFINIEKLSEKKGECLLQFSVKDTGIGIPEDRLNKLFKAFSQVDSSTTRKYGGTGLGLAISKKITEMMGGEIWVESELGKGSIFFFTIKAKSASVKVKKKLKDKTKDLRDLRVLVVDDNETNRKILSIQCSNWEMNPVAVESGPEALKLLEKDKNFDLGILDMHMPDMNGLELGKRIRAKFKKKDLPLVMLSSIGKPSDMAIPEDVFNAFLSKPVKQSHLFDSLVSLLGGKIKMEDTSTGSDKQLDEKMAEEYPLRILLVEDNVINQKIASRIMEKMGYKADTAANGLEALDAVKRQAYDIVFMDVQMPEMDGLEATRKIVKKYKPDERPKIIAMTANAMKEDKEACLEAGMDDYISKPVKVTEVRDAILRWCKLLAPIPKAKKDNRSEELMDWKMIDSIKNLDIGDEEGNLLYDLISGFIDDYPETIRNLETAVEGKDPEKVRSIAHKLKGGGANLGAKGFAKVCYQIELRGREKDLSKVDEWMKKLEPVLKETLKFYQQYFETFDKEFDLKL